MPTGQKGDTAARHVFYIMITIINYALTKSARLRFRFYRPSNEGLLLTV